MRYVNRRSVSTGFYHRVVYQMVGLVPPQLIVPRQTLVSKNYIIKVRAVGLVVPHMKSDILTAAD